MKGMTGNVKVDDNGDREPDYWVWDLVPGATEFHVSMEISLTSADSEVSITVHINSHFKYLPLYGIPKLLFSGSHARNATSVTMQKSYCKKIY
jgi:hypothetical protein